MVASGRVPPSAAAQAAATQLSIDYLKPGRRPFWSPSNKPTGGAAKNARNAADTIEGAGLRHDWAWPKRGSPTDSRHLGLVRKRS